METRVSPRPDLRLAHQLGELTDAASALVRSELRLARAELGDGLRSARRGAVDIALGVVLLLVGFTALAGAAVAALSLVWPVWLAAAAVGGAICLFGSLSVWFGAGRLRRVPPTRTVDEAAATVEMLRSGRAPHHATHTQEPS